jgi:hypothetical protein
VTKMRAASSCAEVVMMHRARQPLPCQGRFKRAFSEVATWSVHGACCRRRHACLLRAHLSCLPDTCCGHCERCPCHARGRARDRDASGLRHGCGRGCLAACGGVVGATASGCGRRGAPWQEETWLAGCCGAVMEPEATEAAWLRPAPQTENIRKDIPR